MKSAEPGSSTSAVELTNVSPGSGCSPSIQEELASVADRQVAVPTVYVTLIRLEERGLVRSTEEPPPEGQGGRPRRVFELTPSGWDALGEARGAADRMWRGVVPP